MYGSDARHAWLVRRHSDRRQSLYAETLTLDCHFFTQFTGAYNITRVAAGRSAVPNNVITNSPD